jgi:Cdc6-like AAA superfamily ATPase
MMETMAEWYGLKDGHRDFFIENDADANLLFARTQLDQQLQGILRKSFRTGNPPKFVLYGDWGVGKTHTMRHIQYVVANNADFSAQIVYVELPDINSKATFQVAHAALLDALGLDVAKNWMVQFQTKHASESQDLIQHQTQSGDVARAFLSLTGFGETARICWDWLRGVPLSASEARSVGLAPALDQSNQLVNVLRMLGKLSEDIDGKLLVFMLDEATKLANVTAGDSINHWLNAFKILSDNQTKEVGFIVSASFRDPDDMPNALADQQVRTRFGDSHYIQLLNFGSEETTEFVTELLKEWIDPTKRNELISKFSTEADSENVTETSFPFTENARTRFVDYACRNGGIATPRDIQKALDDILNRAIDDNRHILSSRYFEGLMAAG